MSCFNLEQADIEVYQQLYDLYEKVREFSECVQSCRPSQRPPLISSL